MPCHARRQAAIEIRLRWGFPFSGSCLCPRLLLWPAGCFWLLLLLLLAPVLPLSRAPIVLLEVLCCCAAAEAKHGKEQRRPARPGDLPRRRLSLSPPRTKASGSGGLRPAPVFHLQSDQAFCCLRSSPPASH
ncbi:hypothetical protein B0T26DRAFT_254547 [Lasiosphaeria miniovina]|uniref:Uncharacterized protein n=1 Tax=Lasiosphaeria miniovina TaxID=1954250 RepID=A0AA40E0A4_9PEZI|nr:uncharacterized protein B0T26DRAFT_254547 [Lasiosphaeria miniovina]KAK0723199.1 hypothetical protein B0T26DRAFT_254547 [Lasiosphaeria miniovina]